METSGLSAFPRLDLEEVRGVMEMYEMYGDFPFAAEALHTQDEIERVCSLVERTEYRGAAVQAISLLMSEGWVYLGRGTTRVALEHPYDSGWIAKVPTTDRGVFQSILESEVSFSEGKNGDIPIADCYLDDRDLILWMERVTPLLEGTRVGLPDWVYLVDCGQVGYDSQGTLVAYDL